VTAFVDTNVLIRHLTGDPPDMAARATAFLAAADELLLSDLIVAETIYVLESFYEVPRSEVAQLARSIVGFPAMRVLDPALLLRALEIYEIHGVDFAEAYLAASAEIAGIGEIASFDRSLDRIPTVRRIEP
jgi:predicted nucleic acid-binding protein